MVCPSGQASASHRQRSKAEQGKARSRRFGDRTVGRHRAFDRAALSRLAEPGLQNPALIRQKLPVLMRSPCGLYKVAAGRSLRVPRHSTPSRIDHLRDGQTCPHHARVASCHADRPTDQSIFTVAGSKSMSGYFMSHEAIRSTSTCATSRSRYQRVWAGTTYHGARLVEHLLRASWSAAM